MPGAHEKMSNTERTSQLVTGLQAVNRWIVLGEKMSLGACLEG